MLYGELKFYKKDVVIKIVDDEEFSEFNHEQLKNYVSSVVAEIGADKAISSCIYHGGAKGTIDTVLFSLNDELA